MGPHDLLCRWCSTFVGKGKKFCSIFCESRYTRSKRRKLAFKRPVYSSGPHTDKEYESPRSNKTAPARKESFLEDVITAIETDKPSPERDKRRPDGNTSASALESPASTDKPANSESNLKKDITGTSIPQLDLSSPNDKKGGHKKTLDSAREKRESKDNIKNKGAETKGLDRHKSASKSNELRNGTRSKTYTLPANKTDSKIPVRNKNLTHDKEDDLNRTDPIKKIALDDSSKTESKATRLSHTNDKTKLENEKGSTADIYNQAVQRQKSKIAADLEKRIRSSGYGNPVNPKLRPMALKPRSATVSSSVTKQKRESSAQSTKSSTIASFSREDSRPVESARDKGNWELIPTTIAEETNRTEITNGNTSLEDEVPTPKSSPRRTGKSGDSTHELAKIGEMLREESTHSDLLSQTELQLRLSSIKKKVQVRKRGRDSRSSYGSDLDESMDLITDREFLNTSIGNTKPTKTSRASARSNITRISKQFQPNTQDPNN